MAGAGRILSYAGDGLPEGELHYSALGTVPVGTVGAAYGSDRSGEAVSECLSGHLGNWELEVPGDGRARAAGGEDIVRNVRAGARSTGGEGGAAIDEAPAGPV